jgi:hypothetical protein
MNFSLAFCRIKKRKESKRGAIRDEEGEWE